MTCINCLNNITPLNMSVSMFANPQTTISETAKVANSNLPYWLLFSMIILFISFVWYIYKNEKWNLDIVQSIGISSFFIISISYAIIRTGLSNNIVPLTMFGLIWIVSIISMIFIKKQG